jgi:hypothetical protein
MNPPINLNLLDLAPSQSNPWHEGVWTFGHKFFPNVTKLRRKVFLKNDFTTRGFVWNLLFFTFTETFFNRYMKYSPIAPHALGEAIDVPFISWDPLSVQLGTDAIAPPGALILTPSEPSGLRSTNNKLLTINKNRCYMEHYLQNTEVRANTCIRPSLQSTDEDCSNTYEGPLDDQVYCIPGIRSSNEYSVSIMSGETYAPTPR